MEQVRIESFFEDDEFNPEFNDLSLPKPGESMYDFVRRAIVFEDDRLYILSRYGNGSFLNADEADAFDPEDIATGDRFKLSWIDEDDVIEIERIAAEGGFAYS